MSDFIPPAMGQMRKNYSLGGLHEKDAKSDPLVQFQFWFEEALEDIPNWFEPNAMTLSTSDSSGEITSRIVLLKGVEEKKFLFYTNYDSTKGSQMRANPRVSLCLFWPHVQRQVRIQGGVAKVSRATSEAYFHSRPRDSQLGAHVSQQSSVIESRGAMESSLEQLKARYPEGTKIPLPENWGGYAVTPMSFEFWQGRPSRLHDRLVYRRERAESDVWTMKRLSP